MNNHGDSRGTGSDGNGHPPLQQQETAVTILTQERERLSQQVQSMTRHARTARAGRSGRHTGDWQARPVRRRSDELRGLVVQTEIVLQSCGPAVSARVGLDHMMLPFLVRHCAWLITHNQVKSDGKTPRERLRGRPYQGQVAEFAGKAADMPKLDDR